MQGYYNSNTHGSNWLYFHPVHKAFRAPTANTWIVKKNANGSRVYDVHPTNPGVDAVVFLDFDGVNDEVQHVMLWENCRGVEATLDPNDQVPIIATHSDGIKSGQLLLRSFAGETRSVGIYRKDNTGGICISGEGRGEAGLRIGQPVFPGTYSIVIDGGWEFFDQREDNHARGISGVNLDGLYGGNVTVESVGFYNLNFTGIKGQNWGTSEIYSGANTKGVRLRYNYFFNIKSECIYLGQTIPPIQFGAGSQVRSWYSQIEVVGNYAEYIGGDFIQFSRLCGYNYIANNRSFSVGINRYHTFQLDQQHGIQLGFNTGGTIVEKNIIDGVHDWGIFLSEQNGPFPTEFPESEIPNNRVTVRYNLIHNMAYGGVFINYDNPGNNPREVHFYIEDNVFQKSHKEILLWKKGGNSVFNNGSWLKIENGDAIYRIFANRNKYGNCTDGTAMVSDTNRYTAGTGVDANVYEPNVAGPTYTEANLNPYKYFHAYNLNAQGVPIQDVEQLGDKTGLPNNGQPVNYRIGETVIVMPRDVLTVKRRINADGGSAPETDTANWVDDTLPRNTRLADNDPYKLMGWGLTFQQSTGGGNPPPSPPPSGNTSSVKRRAFFMSSAYLQ